MRRGAEKELQGKSQEEDAGVFVTAHDRKIEKKSQEVLQYFCLTEHRNTVASTEKQKQHGD